MSYIALPLKNQPVCGHNPKPQMIGREEGMLFVEGKKGTYVRPYVFGLCEACERKAKEDMKKEVEILEA